MNKKLINVIIVIGAIALYNSLPEDLVVFKYSLMNLAATIYYALVTILVSENNLRTIKKYFKLRKL